MLRRCPFITREPALGGLVGERPLVNAHRIPGYAAMNSGSIRLVIELFERYVGLRSSLASTSHEARGKEIQVDFDECLRRILTITIAHSLAS